MQLFQDDEFFTTDGGGITKEELANIVFDDTFTTPLHFAVKANKPELVEFLIEVGAMPQPDFYGTLPWERFGHIPRVNAAARVARSALVRRPHLQTEQASVPAPASVLVEPVSSW